MSRCSCPGSFGCIGDVEGAWWVRGRGLDVALFFVCFGCSFFRQGMSRWDKTTTAHAGGRDAGRSVGRAQRDGSPALLGSGGRGKRDGFAGSHRKNEDGSRKLESRVCACRLQQFGWVEGLRGQAQGRCSLVRARLHEPGQPGQSGLRRGRGAINRPYRGSLPWIVCPLRFPVVSALQSSEAKKALPRALPLFIGLPGPTQAEAGHQCQHQQNSHTDNPNPASSLCRLHENSVFATRIVVIGNAMLLGRCVDKATNLVLQLL